MKAFDILRYLAMKAVINRLVEWAENAPNRESAERWRAAAAAAHDAMVFEGMLKPAAEEVQ
jgi:hypothetical protein